MTDTQTILNFINGQYVAPKSDQWIDNVCPATGAVVGKIANSDASDVQDAFVAANNAFAQWSETPVEKRSAIMMKIADLIEQNHSELSIAESEDCGKPISRARSTSRFASRLAWSVVSRHGICHFIFSHGKSHQRSRLVTA